MIVWKSRDEYDKLILARLLPSLGVYCGQQRTYLPACARSSADAASIRPQIQIETLSATARDLVALAGKVYVLNTYAGSCPAEGSVVANAAQLVEAIATLIKASAAPVPISLMNHGVDEAAAIIGAVVERCAKDNIPLATISIDPELGMELGLADGKILDHGHSPVIRWEHGRGRHLLFQRG